MNLKKTDRLEALFALRRAERAAALTKLEQARTAVDVVLAQLSEKQALMASLAEALSMVEPERRWSGAALTASFDNRRQQSAALLRLTAEETSLSDKATFLELEVEAAKDEVARTQKALSVLKKQLDSR